MDSKQYQRAFGMLGKKKKKTTEMEAVQVPAVKIYREQIRPHFPDSVLIVNSLSDMFFTSETVNRGGKRISKNALLMEKAKRAGFESSQPDIIIVQRSGAFSGIALELKNEGVKLYRQDGKMRKNDHHQAQLEVLDRLSEQGFYARFAVGLEEVKKYFRKYFQIDIY